MKHISFYIKLFFLLSSFLFTAGCRSSKQQEKMWDNAAIQIYPPNPFYWQYKGKPVLLLGGSVDDNLFQIEDLREHLELLHSIGGNYVRCTMSSRDQGNVKPYVKTGELYDLDQPNPVYWNKFEELLSIAEELDIIVQIEIWCPYDYYWGSHGWTQNPFNPKLNINYTVENSQLPDSIDYPPQFKIQPFFQTIPDVVNNRLVLSYQQKFVDQMLAISLNYANVLYCIDNENMMGVEWPKYWADYIREKAQKNKRTIYVTEMWDKWDPSDGKVAGAITQTPDLGDWFAQYSNMELYATASVSNTIEDPQTYQFVEVSNNNAQRGEVHYQTALYVRKVLENSGRPRPINNVKIYGSEDFDAIWAGPQKNAEECFWRNIFAGHASSRFHRPPHGLGLSQHAQCQIKSLRMLTDAMDFFRHEPDNSVLGDREENEAYCLGLEGQEYAVYFTGKGQVGLLVPIGKYELRWLQIKKSQWTEPIIMELPGELKTPTDDQWAVLIRRIE
mgnify:CR=1 FL=1